MSGKIITRVRERDRLAEARRTGAQWLNQSHGLIGVQPAPIKPITTPEWDAFIARAIANPGGIVFPHQQKLGPWWKFW